MPRATRTPVRAQNAPTPAPFLSQAIVVGDLIFCSGQLGVNPTTNQMVEGSIKERTVLTPPPLSVIERCMI